MQVLEKTIRTQAPVSDKAVDAYIEKVMHKLFYPVFLRGKIHQKIYDFLCGGTGLDTALAEMPADQLEFRIGDPGDVAQDFAAVCKYAWLRGPMPVWKKRVIAVFMFIAFVAVGLFAFKVFDQWGFNHGYWGNTPAEEGFLDPSNDARFDVQLY